MTEQVQVSVLRPLLWSVLFSVESQARAMRDVRDIWVPSSLRRVLRYAGREATEDSHPDDRWWCYHWAGILSQREFDELRRSFSGEYEGPASGMLGSPGGWLGWLPALLWRQADDYVWLSALPFPVTLDTDEKRRRWDGAGLDDIIREFEAYQSALAAREEEGH